MDVLLFLILPTFIAGLIQGVTGFGAGIVMMMFLPFFFPVIESAALTGTIAFFITTAMAYQYRKYVNYKMILLPSIIFSIFTDVSIAFAADVNQEILKMFFGIFLVALSLFFLFSPSSQNYKPNRVVSLLFIIFSGITNGLFSIGGPLMVIYFLSKTTKKEEYLGSVQTFFWITSIVSLISRITNGVLITDHLPLILLGVVSILFGLWIANKVVDRLNADTIRKTTYILIGFSGIYNIVSTFI